jgi:hypothetical protein
MSWKLSEDTALTLRNKYLQIEAIFGNTITVPTIDIEKLDRLTFSRYIQKYFGIGETDLKDREQALRSANQYLQEEVDRPNPQWIPRQANLMTLNLCKRAGLRIERLVSIGFDSDASVKGKLGSHDVHISTGLEKSFVEGVPHNQRIRVTFPGKATWADGVLEIHKTTLSDSTLKSLEGRTLGDVMKVDVEGWNEIRVVLANNCKKNRVKIKTSASDITPLFSV